MYPKLRLFMRGDIYIYIPQFPSRTHGLRTACRLLSLLTIAYGLDSFMKPNYRSREVVEGIAVLQGETFVEIMAIHSSNLSSKHMHIPRLILHNFELDAAWSYLIKPVILDSSF